MTPVRRYTRGFLWSTALAMVLLGILWWHMLESMAPRLRKASLLIARNRPADAAAELDRLLFWAPKNQDVVHLRSVCYLKQQDFVGVIRLLEGQQIGNSLKLQMLFVTGLLGDYQMERAATVLDNCVARFPDRIGPRSQLSGLLLAQGRSFEAEETWSEFFRLADISQTSSTDLIKALRSSARTRFHPPSTDQNVEMLHRSLRRHPEQTTVAASLARSLAEAGDVDDASAFYECLLEHDDVAPFGLLNAATFYVEQDQITSAQDCLVRLQDNCPSALARERSLVLCHVHQKLGDLSSTVEAIEAAILSGVPKASLYSRKARILQSLNRAEEAKQAYHRAHELAELELRLWKATRSLPENPSFDECLEVAELYRQLGDDLHFHAWQELAAKLNSTTGYAP